MAPKLATSSRVWAVTLTSLAVFAAAAVVLPLLGSVHVDYGRAWQGLDPDRQILVGLRLPRVLLALIAGGALALSGVLFQALLRDALATPYTLGISSGASLGAVVAITLGFASIWPAAILFGMVTLALVLAVASNRRMLSPFTLLMAGITINSICMAAILFLHSVASTAQSIAITRWLMGGIEAVDAETLVWLTAAIVPALLYCFAQARSWNVLAVGEEWAAIRGVATTRLLLSGYLAGSLLTGIVTSLTGPIGFVGLIVPHAVRMIFGADHRVLIPASFLIGGAFLAICDTVARIALAPAEVPVGVITAMLGGPFFIWILRRR
jgi:iron complex transport system permease protein